MRYPADNEIDVGANDMSAHIQNMANNCPDTRLVLGGYSLGAAVTDVVLAVPFASSASTTRCLRAWTSTSPRSRCSATAPHG